jgi:hypothetical protein
VNSNRIAACVRALSLSALAGCGGHLPSDQLQASHELLLESLARDRIDDPARRVTHASHVCTLRIDADSFPVVDLREIVPGAVSPRGVNAIIVLDIHLRLVRRIEYTTERPLFCVANPLYVWGDLRIDGVASEGSELTFADRARTVTPRHVEANDMAAPQGNAGPASQ